MSSVEKKLLCFKINQKNIVLLHDKFKKYFYHMTDVKKLSQYLRNFLIVTLLLLSAGTLFAQGVVVTSVTPQPASVDFADTNFQMDLQVGLTLPVGVTTAEVKVTFATGLEYVSVNPGAGAISVARKAGDTDNKAPTFTVTGTAGAPLVFTVKKKVTQAALDSFTSSGVQFYDQVSATPAGPNSNRQSTAYKLNWPVLQITLDAGAVTEPVGTYTHSFTVKNTSEFKLKEIYFSVAYPAGIEKVSLTAPSGYTLTAVGTVPTGKGLPSEGKDLYKLTKAGSFAANETITLTEKYKVKTCGSGSIQVDYTPYWGPSATELYWKVGINTPASRTVNLKAVNTTTVQVTGPQENYFEWKDGLCGAVVGTGYTAYKNNSADNSTAYKNRIRIAAGGIYIPTNISIIAADNTKILLSPGNGTTDITLDLNDLAALSVTALAGKDVGLTDEDNDGFADDLKKDAVVRICYDLKTQTGATTFTCVNKVTNFNMSVAIFSSYEDACGQEKAGARYNPQSFGREFSFTDGSAQPAQLVKDQAIEGYLMLSYGYLSAYQNAKGQSWKYNDIRYRYYAKLPQGVKMKNIRYYYGQDPNDRTVPSVPIADVPAGGVLDYIAMTNNYPAGTDNDMKGKKKPGYIAYELELGDCTGVGLSANLEYHLSVLDENEDGTFCEIPRVCEIKAISMGCPTTTCALKGPQMLSTKVERTDDSYGWTNATMTHRVARTAVTASQRRRALHLDHIEVISEGQQSDAGPTDNLYYYMAIVKTAELEPKSIKVKVGSYETTLQASAVVSRAEDAQGKYFRWNLTSALPAGVLAAGQKFSVVATYQVIANPTDDANKAIEIQSGQTSFFYSLDDKTDNRINPQGYHIAQQHCGVDLIPVFNIVGTFFKFASNQFTPEACKEYALGGYMMYASRTTSSTNNFTGEYRPGRRIKKITIKMPPSYRIVKNEVKYYYSAVPSDIGSNSGPSVSIPLSKWTMSEGTERVYTYTNPSNTADPYYLPPGMVTTKGSYAEYLQPFVQASCSTKEATSIFAPSDNTDAKKQAALKAAGQKASIEVEYEDYYYHYAKTALQIPVVNKSIENPMWYSKKPQLVINAEGQGLSFIANAAQQEARFSLSVPVGAPNAPYAWVSIPDVPGMEVLSLQETNAAGVPQGTPFTPETISGEKMFHVSQLITATKKYYTVKFKLTNCMSALKFKLYAGWNCSGYPTGGYRTTCATSSGTEAYKEFTVTPSNAQKQITADNTNPGQPGYVHQGLDINKISMCQDTPYTYTIKSAGTGDIFKANLVVRKKSGLTIHKVKVEYDGVVYDTIVSNPKHIGIERNGDVTTYKLEDILPGGKLPGSLNEANPNKQQLKLTFSVLPTCNFNIGSSFDIDIVGENFCGGAATGQKTEEMVAGIIGANSDYTANNTLTYLSGNANLCAGLGGTGARYHGRTQINITGSAKRTGATGRLYIRVPKGFKYRAGSFTPTYTPPSYTEVNPGPPAIFTSYPVLPPTVLSYNTIGDETEIEIQIPQNLKNGHYFEYELEVYQDMNIPAQDCDQAAKLKYYTTDKITNLACPLLPSPSICHDVTIITGAEQKVDIHTERAELAITQVKTTSEMVAGQEKVTFKYKVKNNSTTTAHNTILKVALYKDANNDGDLEDSELVDTFTDGAALPTGGEQEFTHDKLLPHTDICRLYLVIRNKDNNCLCSDVKVAVPSPETITGLMDNADGCESNPYTFALKPGVPTYDSYTWEAISPADALSYLSATNVATPTFTYTGAKLTATTEFKYKLKVTRPNGGCESSQEVKLTVKPAPSITQPTAPANPYCTGTTAASLSVVANDHGVAGTLTYEWYENITNSYTGATLKYTGQPFTPPTNLAGTKYYFVKVKNSGCGETLSNIIMVKTNATPAQPIVAQAQAAGCGTVSTAKVSNHSSYTAGITFKVTKGGTLVSATVASNGTINGISEAGTYVIKAVEDGCESAGTTFTIADKKPVPDKPTLTLTAESCTSATVANITNHAAGKTYTFIKSSDNSTVTASVDGTGKITSLAIGKYKIKATQGGCTSELSDEFEIKAQKDVPTKPAITLTAETCASPTIAKITNYDPNQTYWLNGTQLTVTLTGEIQSLGLGSHTITAKNGSCESAASDSFTIKAKKTTPAVPTVSEHTAATCSAISIAKLNYTSGLTYIFVKSDDNSTVSGTSVDNTGKISGLPVGKYKVKAKKGDCESALSAEFEIKDKKLTPAKPIVAEDTAATCTAISIAKLTNYDANFTYTFIKSSDGSTVSGVTMASDGKISGLAVGKYKVKATKDGCISDLSDEFEIKDIKPIPAVPTVSEHTAATCAAISIAKLNYTSGFDYIFVKSDDNTEVTATSVDNTGKISGLSVGKYKVKAKKDGCESALSAEFEIKDKLPTPAAPTIGEKTAATCTAISVAKVDNYSSYSATDVFAILDSSNTVVATALVASDGTINGLTTAGTYKITVTNTQGCTSAEATITIADVLPVPATPAPTATQSFCNSATVADLAPQGTDIKWYDAATGGSLLTSTTALVHNNKYYAARTLGSCESPRAEVTVKIISLAQPTLTATAVAPTCTAEGKAKITNYDSNATYTFTKADGTAVTETITIAADGIVTGLVAGSYKVKASKDGCEATSADFQIADKLPAPAAPTIGEKTAATCTAISVAKVTDYDNGLTYTIKDSANATVGNVENDGTISGLTAAGSYKITATNTQGCTSAEATITINPVQAAPAKPAITLTPASCTSPTVAKLTQVSGLTFWHNGTQLTVNPITHEITGLAPGTYTITAKNNDNCESVASDSFEIKAQQTATTITTAPAGATYQRGDEATPLSVTATGEGTLSYQWFEANSATATGTAVGSNSASYTPSTATVGSKFYYVEVTSTCGAVKSDVAEIKVVEGAPTIEANDDPDTTVRRGQEVAVLGNDKVNGNPATPADVDITISNDGGLTRVGVNPATGKIMIPNDAAPATYEITYKICVKNQPTICDEAKVKITVEVPVRALKAVDDDFGNIPNAVDYTTVATVFSTGVDTMEGVVGNLSPERDVVLTPGAVTRDGATITEGITMNPNGSITVKRGTPKGTYTYEYTICQKDVPTNCDTAKVSFEVIEAHIFAKDDGVWEVGTEGALTPSILNNDILGERVGIAPSEVDIQQTQGEAVIDKTKMVMNEDGRISVKKDIAEGTYTYYYTITEKANTANFSSAKVIIRVVNFSAQDDEFNITNDKTKEFKTESVLANDELNKKKNPSPVDDVILTIGEAKDAERKPTTALTMNDDGTITIAPNTPDGVYTYTYTICKTSARTECKSAEAVIKLLPALIANDDDFTANPINPLVREGIAGNVLDNDRYADGNALEHLDKVQITMLDNDKSGARIEQNGNVVIPQGAPAGEYTLTYSLCMKDHPTICAEAKVKIVILEDKPIVIHNGISANGDGVNDGFMIEHIEGYPKNNLKIFNRWGVLVYEKDGYTNSEPFDGHSNGRATISADSKLPQGTYYYILEYQDTAEQTHTKKGWLYLKY